MIEGVDELLAAPADVGRSAAEVDVGVARNQGASLVDPLAVDHDLAGQDEASRLLATLHQALVDQQLVQAHP